MERRIDVIVNDTVMDSTGELITFSGTLRARKIDSCEKASVNEWCNLYGENSLFAIDLSGINYSCQYHPKFRPIEHVYTKYVAVCRMVNRAMARCGMTFDGYLLTENGDLEKAKKCTVLEDGRVFKYSECDMCEDTGKITPAKDMRVVEGHYHLKENVERCPYCGHRKLKGQDCTWCNVKTWDGRTMRRDQTERVAAYIKNEYGNLAYGELVIAKGEELKGYKKCNVCGTYYPDDTEFDYGMCRGCLEDNVEYGDYIFNDDSELEAVINEYHGNNKDHWFGNRDKTGFHKGLGFELEIDGCEKSGGYQSRFNNILATDILKFSGLENGEVCFETDSSLRSGFEIISMPHTADEFWKKKECWKKMLEMCSKRGFKSHDTGTCGLHIHVSWRMFGSDKETQECSLAKVHKLYSVRWGELLLASRRRNFNFCSPNLTVTEDMTLDRNSGVKKWKKTVGNGGHHSAINDDDEYTVEFRLGRGTLNASSFFAWIDLTLAIVRNSRKGNKLLFSKTEEWLKGISRDTAEYLLSRRAFMEECRTLYPELGGDNDSQQV